MTFFWGGVVEPLWYFPALIIGLNVFKVLYKKDTLKYLWMVSGVCYFLYIISETYFVKNFVTIDNLWYKFLYGSYSSLINGPLGCALLYLTIGAFIAKTCKRENINNRGIWNSVLVSLILFHIEVLISVNSGYYVGMTSSYFMLPFFIYTLMKTFVRFPEIFRCDFFEKYQYSAGMYVVHVFYLVIVRLLFKVLNIELNSILYTIIVVLFSFYTIKLLKNNNGYVGRFFAPYI